MPTPPTLRARGEEYSHTHVFDARKKQHFSIFALACFRTLGSIEQEAWKSCKKKAIGIEGERTNSVLRIYALYLVEAISMRQGDRGRRRVDAAYRISTSFYFEKRPPPPTLAAAPPSRLARRQQIGREAGREL